MTTEALILIRIEGEGERRTGVATLNRPKQLKDRKSTRLNSSH